MAWPEIDRVIMPNGRIITVCLPHQMVTCGKCCLDFSLELEEDDEDYLDEDEEEDDDDELFGFDSNSHVPRDVSANQVAYSRHGRLGEIAASGSRRPSTPFRFRPTWAEDLDEDEDEDYDDMQPLVDATPPRESKHLFIRVVRPSNTFTIKSADPEAPKQPAPVFQPTTSNPLGERMQFSGTLFPTKFGQHKKKTPLSPEELFPPGRCMKLMPPVLRFINRYDTSEALIYTDGACFGNGNAAARGGSAFIFKPVYANDQSGRVAFKLEDQGPDGKTYRHTSNRAELRAAVAALRYRAWSGEGFRSIVIATDSTYVVNGATDWARAWVKKGWRLSTGENVKNRDLWEALLLNVERLHDQSVSVRFWWIPRKFNHEADRAAKGAASILAPRIEFGDLIGVRV